MSDKNERDILERLINKNVKIFYEAGQGRSFVCSGKLNAISENELSVDDRDGLKIIPRSKVLEIQELDGLSKRRNA